MVSERMVRAEIAQAVSGLRMKDQPNVLLVDDSAENLVSLEAALEGLDAEMVAARSGTEALRHLLERDFAAIILDVKMPDMDGFQTAEMIRSRKRSRHTPILFLPVNRATNTCSGATIWVRWISFLSRWCPKFCAPRSAFS